MRLRQKITFHLLTILVIIWFSSALGETTHRVPAYGPLTPLRIQQSVIVFLLLSCGVHILRYADPKNLAYPLERILRHTQFDVAPTIPTRTLRRWFYYYMIEGEVPAQRVCRMIRRLRQSGRYRQRCRRNRSQWDTTDSVELRRILDAFPGSYLDEIVFALEVCTGKRWSVSQISKKLEA